MATTKVEFNSGHAHDKDYLRGKTIDEFFAGTMILLTGATGFLGKALLEKLLHSCPVAAIFVLIRPKKDKTIEQRFEELLNDPVFDKIRSEFPSTLKKIFPVKGDVGLPELGLQPKDRDMLLQNVNIVFHSAATVRFDEPLKIAVNLNVIGTDRILDLCRRMTNLTSVIHVSTAYSNVDRREIEELIYTTKVKPHTVIRMCEILNDKMLKIIEKELIGQHPNTYTFTKNLAEQIIKDNGKDLPIAIIRPSIIGAANKDPFPGWIDNINGITGLMMAVAQGTVRSIVCNEKLKIDIIPVDFVVNTMISASWYNFVQRIKTIKVYNCTSSTLHPITWNKFGYFVQKHCTDVPSKHVIWYPGFKFTTNKFIHAIIKAILHFLPALILDFILKARGHNPIMLKLYKRVDLSAKTGEYFSTHEWMWHVKNIIKLTKFTRAHKIDKKFNINIQDVDWDRYLYQYLLGIRKYILNDNLDTLPNAQNRLKKLYWIHQGIKIFSIALFCSGIIAYWRY
ncbi:putative fatty acyl-CoA reductase CG5065 isoform X2 [Solenopsis invicta]|nr:putative fatty acyl-CoA reductase CG5065 isoform X2 [Solenopsis invicta]